MREKHPFKMEIQFGLLLAALLAIASTYNIIIGRNEVTAALLTLLLFTLSTLMCVPSMLSPLVKTWLYLGDLLARIIRPIVLTALYITIVLPIGILFRLTKRDALLLRAFDESTSTWGSREEEDVINVSFKDQY